MHKIGDKFVDGVERFDPHAEYMTDHEQHELTLFLVNPAINEVDAVSSDQWRFDLYKRSTALFVSFECGSLVGVTNFNINMVPGDIRLPTASTRRMLVTLVDASNGIVKAVRELTIPVRMARSIAAIVLDQVDDAFDRSAHEALVMNTRSMYGYTDIRKMSFAYFRRIG